MGIPSNNDRISGTHQEYDDVCLLCRPDRIGIVDVPVSLYKAVRDMYDGIISPSEVIFFSYYQLTMEMS